jgi:hypothetical protein
VSQTTTERPPSLYAAREPIFPRRVHGRFRNLKWWIMGLTLAIYYITPWIRWDRGPSLPDQAVLVDLQRRGVDLVEHRAALAAAVAAGIFARIAQRGLERRP